MLMSKSRLEKFLYALYSLDSSDLPTPLSRIEELYKCLVTGEEPPTFEPLSRVEKYLMAILGGYDVDSLPNPLSRVEVLLYKLATGDYNLDDVKSFLSEHEELLAEIIRNGGVGGNIDIEYVLYTLSTEFNTLYNTAEKPVKSAILKGQTLVNLFNINDVEYYNNDKDHYIENDYIVLPVVNKRYNHIKIPKEKCSMFKPSTKYTLWVHMLENHTEDNGDGTTQQKGSFWLQSYDYSSSIVKSSNNGIYGCMFEINETGIKSCVFETHDLETMATKTQGINFDLSCYYAKTGGIQKLAIVILEGEYRREELPFNNTPFNGMKSVKMPVLTTVGKNLFDGKLEYGIINGTNGRPYDSNDYVRTQDFIPINYEKITYTVINEQCGLSFYFYDKDKNFISSATMMNVNGNLSMPEGVAYLKFRTYPLSNESVTTNLNTQIQIEESSIVTEYEPYKSNILTVNEDVELRGIGDVRDTLDLMTGELTLYINKLKNEEWNINYNITDYISFITVNRLARIDIKPICNIIEYGDGITTNSEFIMVSTSSGRIIITIKKSRLIEPTVACFKKLIDDNEIEILYAATEKVIKTVDLSVIDQDGNGTKLSTFDDLTHVTLSSEGLIPGAELEVATKNEEVLNTMSLEMDDISATQSTLEETSNTQSENVDATMIATTEIYEQLL